MKRKKPNRPLVIGLTGSIGMGKSTAAKILGTLGLSVHNADKVVHELLRRKGKAVKAVAEIFPEAFKRGVINRGLLGKIVFNNRKQLKRLEKILHPHVRAAEKAFLIKAAREKKKAVVLEIPLLFETRAEKRCAIVLCVTAPRSVQKQRLMKRKGMTTARFQAILKQQMPDREKRRRADYVIHTGKSLADTRKQLIKIWKVIQEKH